MSEKHNIIISQKEISHKVEILAKKINSDYSGKTLDLICLSNSALFYTIDIIKQLTIPTRLHFLGFSSYTDGNKTGEICINLDIKVPLFNKDVLVFEGIIVSGRTPRFIIESLKNRNPSSIALCALGTKPHLLNEKLPLSYIGFELGTEIVVGYGIGSDSEMTKPYLFSKNN